MIKHVNLDVIEKIKTLYRSNRDAVELFDWMATRQRDATETSMERISFTIRKSRGKAVALARKLEEVGCGEFVVGRRGSKSRFKWAYSCISLGKVAAGEADNLEEAEDPITGDEEENTAGTSKPLLPLTIAEAKQLLAASLGVPISNIEIVVRA